MRSNLAVLQEVVLGVGPLRIYTVYTYVEYGIPFGEEFIV